MKVEIENLRLAKSPITDNVYVGVLDASKGQPKWKHKKDVTSDFISAVLERWNGFREEISDSEGNTYEIQVKKVKKAK